MLIEQDIKKLKQEVDREISVFLDGKLLEARKNRMPLEFFQMADNIKDFILRGGKRLRPILFYYGYVLSGGQEKKEALKASAALEFLHAGLLIHDDIMDRDSTRHGGPSMHMKYEDDYRSKIKQEDLQHFGLSMAICVGDVALYWSYEILGRSSFGAAEKGNAIAKLSNVITETSVGQMLDEILQQENNFDEKIVYDVYDCKTARYTVRGPLQIGAALAGAQQEELDFISRFSIPLGIAYQIKDDIIGIFGEEEKIGKPVGSDIKEGKKTLLVCSFLKNTNAEDKKIVLDNLGNKNIDKDAIEKIKEAMIRSGALKYCEEKIDELTDEFLHNLKSAPGGFSEKYAPLEGLADFLLNRQK